MTILASAMRKAKGWMMRNVHSMITCAEFETFVLDYFEDDLPPAQRRVFELHLKVCRDCRDYLEAYRRSVAMGKSVFEERDAAAPRDVPEDLIKAVLKSRAAER